GEIDAKRKLNRINRAESPLCPCCHQSDETVMHYLLRCPAHANARAELHRKGGRDSRVLEKLLTRPKLLPPLFQYIARSEKPAHRATGAPNA
ncbi:hypothetical protein B0H14DRAFT_2379309, partial [Mycena olivaceomarginata]